MDVVLFYIACKKEMDVSEVTLYCGVALAFCVALFVFVCVSRWISKRTNFPFIVTLIAACLPNVWLGLVIVAIIHS